MLLLDPEAIHEHDVISKSSVYVQVDLLYLRRVQKRLFLHPLRKTKKKSRDLKGQDLVQSKGWTEDKGQESSLGMSDIIGRLISISIIM